MTTTHADNEACPSAILGWIPWYPDELDAEQRGAVEVHAAGCRECRREIALLRGDEADPAPAPDPERVYAQVLARIESDHGSQRTELEAPIALEPVKRGRIASERTAAPGAPRREPRRLLSLGDTVTRTFALAASLAIALVVGGLGGAWLIGERTPPEPVYETASASPVTPPTGAGAVEVVFRENVEMTRISEALRAIGAQITSGPSQLGVYRLELGADVDPDAAAKLLRGDRDGVAIFAEPGGR